MRGRHSGATLRADLARPEPRGACEIVPVDPGPASAPMHSGPVLDAGAAILAELGVRRLRLMTNNPDKLVGLVEHGLEVVGRVASPVAVTPHSAAYLRTKRTRMGHRIGALDG